MQVYRGMDIGTAKPSARARSRVRHHLIDIADPKEQYNAGRFVKDAEAVIAEVSSRGKTSVVSGGTAFYLTSLLYGLPESPPVDPETRERLRGLLAREGQAALYQRLQEQDPDAAARIQRNDRYRTLRALEVMEGTRRSLFSFRWPRTLRQDMRFLLLGLHREREELYQRIGRRVCAMFDEGLVLEVRALLEKGYGSTDPGMRGIGYRQVLAMRDGCETLTLVRERIAGDTRRYAKRQLTFFRAVPGVTWVAAEKVDELAERMDAFLASTT
jgi:tRNA dimethylallyltransferase